MIKLKSYQVSRFYDWKDSRERRLVQDKDTRIESWDSDR